MPASCAITLAAGSNFSLSPAESPRSGWAASIFIITFASSGEDDAEIDAACDRAREALAASDSLPPEALESELAVVKSELAKLARWRKTRAKGPAPAR